MTSNVPLVCKPESWKGKALSYSCYICSFFFIETAGKNPNYPIAEFLVTSPTADSIGEAFELKLQRSFPDLLPDNSHWPQCRILGISSRTSLPKDGFVELPHDKPGFGVTLNK